MTKKNALKTYKINNFRLKITLKTNNQFNKEGLVIGI